MLRRTPLRRISKNPANVRLRQAKKKQITVSKLSKQLEALQKRIVIQKYGRDCYTCSAIALEGKNCQLGHVPWPRSVLSTECKFDPAYTRIQCMVCNIHRGGMGAEALQHLIRDGIDVEALKRRNQETKGLLYGKSWVEAKIIEYTELLAQETT